MKTLVVSAILCCALALLPCASSAQTITINSVSGTNFCMGDSVSVSFTVTGLWGHRNAFTLQLSDSAGNFSSFQNLASIVDTLPGTLVIVTKIPANTATSSHYRFRILGANPYFISPDNGSDITINIAPFVGFDFSINAGSTGTPITLSAYADNNVLLNHAFWDFGTGAIPATATTTGQLIVNPDFINPDLNDTSLSFSQNVTYSTPGDKIITITVVSPEGCSSTATYKKLHVYDCSTPSIPHNAIVIKSDTIVTGSGVTYWLNPGVKVYFQWDHDTIFAEPGSTISEVVNSLVYVKSGSVLKGSLGENRVIYADGASINSGPDDYTLNCPGLDFDYSNAPPNKAFETGGVAMDAVAKAISIAPNPTNGSISVSGIPHNAINISVLDLLGATVMNFAKPNANMQIDLSALSSGAYYVRFSMPNGVVTKKIVKE